MKKNISFKTLNILAYTICFIIVLVFDSCKQLQEFVDTLNNQGNNINATLDQAMGDLNANAANYEQIMREAIDKINSQTIKAQLQDALNGAIVTAGIEYKCSLSFTADYLIKRIRDIKSTLNNVTPPIENPVVCTLLPDYIDMNLPVNVRNKTEITGYFLNQYFNGYKLYHYYKNGSKNNVTQFINAISDFKLFINLGSNGVVLTTESDKLVLEWNGNIITTISIVQKTIEPCQLRDNTLQNLPAMTITPVHETVGCNNGAKGDREFNGNGPCTTGWVNIFTANDGTEIWAEGKVEMWECPDDYNLCRSDYTSGVGYAKIKLTNVEAGWRVIQINDATHDWFQNIDRICDQSESVAGSGPVSSYLIFGDYNGDDIGSSHVVVYFKNIKVTLEKIGDCIRH
jgi:hypothetical protein